MVGLNSYKNTAKAVHFHASNNEKYGENYCMTLILCLLFSVKTAFSSP